MLRYTSTIGHPSASTTGRHHMSASTLTLLLETAWLLRSVSPTRHTFAYTAVSLCDCSWQCIYPIPLSYIRSSLMPVSMGDVASLAANSPSLDGEDNDFPGHQQSNQSHGDGEHYHGIQIVVNHAFNRVTNLLRSVICASRVFRRWPTCTTHEYDASRNQAKRSKELRRGSRWKDRLGWLEEHENVGEASGKSSSTEEVTPLPVHHTRNHAMLSVGAHHDT